MTEIYPSLLLQFKLSSLGVLSYGISHFKDWETISLGITETPRVVQLIFRSHLKVGLLVGRDLSYRECLNDGNTILASLSIFPQFKLSCFEIESLPASNFKDWKKIWIDIDYRKLGVRLGWTLKVEIRHYWYTTAPPRVLGCDWEWEAGECFYLCELRYRQFHKNEHFEESCELHWNVNKQALVNCQALVPESPRPKFRGMGWQ